MQGDQEGGLQGEDGRADGDGVSRRLIFSPGLSPAPHARRPRRRGIVIARSHRLQSRHVWMSPADQGGFSALRWIVGAVMSSTFRAENGSAGPDAVR